MNASCCLGGNGACTKDYIDHGGKLLAEYRTATSGFNYYTSDQINSTRTATNGSGNVVYAGVADPFGGMQKEWTTTYNPSLKFSGKEREYHSGIDYFGARYYEHSKYSFQSGDPAIDKDGALSNPQLWNFYSYCVNNPITLNDPDGRRINYRFFNNIMELNAIKIYLSKDSRAQAIIHQAETMDETINLVHSPMVSIHKKGTIWFDPYAGNKLDDGDIQSAALMFVHELSHAIDYLLDPVSHKVRQGKLDKQYETKEERRVILNIESPIANGVLKEPSRINHNGTLVSIPCPTYHEHNNRNK